MADKPTELQDPTPGVVAVGSLSQAKRHKRRFDAVLTLEDPRVRRADQLRFTTKPAPAHLVLKFEDADDESLGYAVATREQVEAVLAFGREAATGSLLVHCFHGVGRSAACALAILADRLGPGLEEQAVAQLFTGRPEATPNLVVVGLADTLLGRESALVAALSRYEDTTDGMAWKRARRAKFAAENPDLYAKKDG